MRRSLALTLLGVCLSAFLVSTPSSLSAGNVKSVSVTGGHPLLGQAAVEAIRKSKWEPSPRETHELITVNFHP
jgi:hypothetical protein